MNKPTASKLFKLKKWLSLEDAAKHLTNICGEDVKPTDILELALYGHIKLSVFFEKPTFGESGYIIHWDDVKKETDPYWLETEINDLKNGISLRLSGKPLEEEEKIKHYGDYIGNGSFFRTVKNSPLSEITGVWDLPMLAGERCNVEETLQQLKKWPSQESVNIDGAFITNEDGKWFKLVDKVTGNDGYEETFYPPNNLPDGYVFVVKTNELQNFERSMSDEHLQAPNINKTNGHQERHAQKREQILGAAFAVLAKWPNECRDSKGKPVASKIANLVEAEADLFWPDSGLPLTVDSIADHLRDWIKMANSRK